MQPSRLRDDCAATLFWQSQWVIFDQLAGLGLAGSKSFVSSLPSECCHCISNLVEVFPMMRKIATRFACWMTLVSLAAALAVMEHPAVGAEGKAPVKKTAGRKGHRLPAHYSQVVNEKQREEIYQNRRRVSAKDRGTAKASGRAEESAKTRRSRRCSPRSRRNRSTRLRRNAKANRKSKEAGGLEAGQNRRRPTPSRGARRIRHTAHLRKSTRSRGSDLRGLRFAERYHAAATVLEMSILSSRASQPRACMTLSRGSPIALTSLAIVMVPFSERVHQTTPAISPIDATHEAEDVVVIWSPRYHDRFGSAKNTTRRNYSQSGQVCKV